jgi:hypothetical protein
MVTRFLTGSLKIGTAAAWRSSRCFVSSRATIRAGFRRAGKLNFVQEQWRNSFGMKKVKNERNISP